MRFFCCDGLIDFPLFNCDLLNPIRSDDHLAMPAIRRSRVPIGGQEPPCHPFNLIALQAGLCPCPQSSAFGGMLESRYFGCAGACSLRRGNETAFAEFRKQPTGFSLRFQAFSRSRTGGLRRLASRLPKHEHADDVGTIGKHFQTGEPMISRNFNDSCFLAHADLKIDPSTGIQSG